MFASLRRLLDFWRPHRLLGAGLVVTMMLRAVFTVVLALAIKAVIDQVIDPTVDRSVWAIAGFLLAGFTISVVAGLVAARLTATAAADIIADVRTALFLHLQRLSMAFHDRAGTGDLISHFTSDISHLSRGVISKPLIGLRAVTAMALYLPVMVLLDWHLAVISLIAVPLAVYLVSRLVPDSAPALDEEKERIADVIEEVSGNLRAQQVIRAYALRTGATERFHQRIEALRSASDRAERRVAFEMVVSEYAVEFTKLVILVFGAWAAFQGALDPGSFAAFAAILTEFSYQASVLGMDVVPSIKQSQAGIRRIDALIAEKAVSPHTGTGPSPRMCGPISFESVVFRYEGSEEAQLKGISVELPAESHVAIVGRNGSGKSSLLNVLLGLYAVEGGAVRIDGTDLADVDIEAARRNTGVAFQETFLFDSSLRENVTLGSAGYSDADVERAVTEAGLASVVDKLPGGVDAPIGATGLTLSTGESQRVGIARALLREPELLLLDEVASGLDPESESELLQVIEALRPGRTIVSVTHRLESVKTADLIVVMRDGRVVETSTFDELLGSSGEFSSMWTRQHGFDVSANGLSATIRSERLRAIPIFSSINDDVLGDLAAVFESRRVGDGEVVVSEGQLGDAFFVIARGQAEVVVGTGTPEERVVAVLEDGDFFGEMALLSSEPRNATVRSRGTSTLLELGQRRFAEMLATVPGARAVVEETAAARAAENARIIES